MNPINGMSSANLHPVTVKTFAEVTGNERAPGEVLAEGMFESQPTHPRDAWKVGM